MNKLLPIFIAATVYLTPLYPVYAQTPANIPAVRPLKNATSPAGVKAPVIEAKMEQVREKVASRAAALKAKLEKFKDKNKALRLETVNQNLGTINSKSVAHFEDVLGKISTTLENLKTKMTEAQTAGKDVTEIKEAIDKAEEEWTQADEAVKTQAIQDYSIVVNTEKTIQTDAKAARDDLHQDLKNTHTQVVEARQALASAISTALSSLSGGNNGSE